MARSRFRAIVEKIDPKHTGGKRVYRSYILERRGNKEGYISTTVFGTRKAAEKDNELKLARYQENEAALKRAKLDEYDIKAYARRGGHIVDREYARSYKGQEMKRGRVRTRMRNNHIGYTVQVTNTTKNRRIK